MKPNPTDPVSSWPSHAPLSEMIKTPRPLPGQFTSLFADELWRSAHPDLYETDTNKKAN